MQTPGAPAVVGHSESALHARQAFVSQIGVAVASRQSELVTHWTHAPVDAQTVFPTWDAQLLVVAVVGVHARQTFPLQIGFVVSVVQSVSAAQATHAPTEQTGVVG
jgi:hypothetical protein